MVPTPAKYSGINEEFLQSLGGEPLKTIGVEGTPFSPLLLVVAEEGGNTRHFVIDTWGTDVMDLAPNGEITETFTGTAHKASEEEIKEFLKEEE